MHISCYHHTPRDYLARSWRPLVCPRTHSLDKRVVPFPSAAQRKPKKCIGPDGFALRSRRTASDFAAVEQEWAHLAGVPRPELKALPRLQTPVTFDEYREIWLSIIDADMLMDEYRVSECRATGLTIQYTPDCVGSDQQRFLRVSFTTQL